jgi:hypothetical protein
MSRRELLCIKAILKRTTFKDCLEWLKQTQEQEEVLCALKALLFERESAAVRVVSDRILRGELLGLARRSSAFRRFLAGKFVEESLDRMTAQYLEDLEEQGLL